MIHRQKFDSYLYIFVDFKGTIKPRDKDLVISIRLEIKPL